MTLDKYRSKRTVENSQEPEGTLINSSDCNLRFVIQKHQASHLHYDLRIELDGVLKSWAIPKGFPSDPSQKRLAVQVEDHPLEYRNFEGIIPEGNYGAGTVLIWDEGWYDLPDIKTKPEIQKKMRELLNKGHIIFSLHGHKIDGMFHLVRTKTLHKQDSWLLFIAQNFHCHYNSFSEKSVRSGKTMDQIRSTMTKESNLHSILNSHNLSDLQSLTRHNEPVKPMMAQLVHEPFNRQGWIFEIKWDGYRAIAEISKGKVKLYSRNGKSLDLSFPPIVDNLQLLDFDMVIDGEIVIVNNEGKSDFNALQNFVRTRKGCLVYYVFDLLFLEEYDLRRLPLVKRKDILKTIIPELAHIRYNDHIKENGVDFFRIAKENNIEGIMAKDANSPYLEGERSWYWQKIKNTLQQEFVVGGYTQPKGTRRGIGSLLVGIYHNRDLIFCGGAGGGFSDDELEDIYTRLHSIKRDSSPFKEIPFSETKAIWVEPVLVCEIRFAEWTAEGLLRHPVFLGFRDDITPYMVHREAPLPESNRPAINKTVADERIEYINGKSLKVTNLNKIFWPEKQITKGALIDYYHHIAPYILPYLKNRPQSLHRYPDGITGKHFFHKDITDAPEWAETVTIQSESQQDTIRYLLCQDEAALIYIVNLGAIEINVWNSGIANLKKPDYMVIDLDPLDCPFNHVIRTALSVHELLVNADIPHYLKTSGATGLHIFTPVNARYSYTQVRDFSFIICTIINKLLPDITSLERMPKFRAGKVYLDFLQNAYAKTMAAVYSLRPRPGAPVSTPLHWEELTPELQPEAYNIDTIFTRLEQYEDLWKPVIGKGVDIGLYLPYLQKVIDEIG